MRAGLLLCCLTLMPSPAEPKTKVFKGGLHRDHIGSVLTKGLLGSSNEFGLNASCPCRSHAVDVPRNLTLALQVATVPSRISLCGPAVVAPLCSTTRPWTGSHLRCCLHQELRVNVGTGFRSLWIYMEWLIGVLLHWGFGTSGFYYIGDSEPVVS